LLALDPILLSKTSKQFSEGNEGETQMRHCQIVFATLFPANQYPAKTVQPAMSSLHHPTTCSKTNLFPQRLRLFTARTDMQRVMKFICDPHHFVADVSGIQAQMLSMITPHLRPFDRNAVQCRFHQTTVMPVRSRDLDAEWNAFTIGQQTTFSACFSAICRIITDFFPRRAVLSSSLHPSPATSREFLFYYRTQLARSSTIVETNPPWSIPETASGRSSRSKFPSRRGLSIGNRYERRTGWRRTPCDRRLAFARRLADGC